MKLGLTWRQKLGDPECPYMERWALSLGRNGPSLRLHRWFRSDDKRFKHDHPADFITLVLKGRYVDTAICPACRHPDCEACEFDFMKPGSIRYRRAEHAHTVDVQPPGCWTLCFFFPDRRKWGFWTTRADGSPKWKKSNKFFLEHGHHPCDQP